MNTVNYNDAEQLFGAVGTSLKKHAAEIADNVNVYGAKNLIPYPYYNTTKTHNGVTFTDNGDGTVTANGTASANAVFYMLYNSTGEIDAGDYILNGCPEGGGNSSYVVAWWNNTTQSGGSDIGAGIPLSYNGTDMLTVTITVYNGAHLDNVLFKPMVRLASIEDGTYVPYAKTNKELTDDITQLNSEISDIVNVYGAKNLLNPQGNDKGVKTLYGVTFTPLADGTFLVNSNGAATGQARYYFASDMVFKENVIFSVEGAQSGKVQAWCNNKHVTNPLTIDANDALDTTFLFVNTGDTVTNVIVKPMIRLASIEDNTYVPYAKSNKELTDDIASLAARIKAIEDTNHLTYG